MSTIIRRTAAALTGAADAVTLLAGAATGAWAGYTYAPAGLDAVLHLPFTGAAAVAGAFAVNADADLVVAPARRFAQGTPAYAYAEEHGAVPGDLDEALGRSGADQLARHPPPLTPVTAARTRLERVRASAGIAPFALQQIEDELAGPADAGSWPGRCGSCSTRPTRRAASSARPSNSSPPPRRRPCAPRSTRTTPKPRAVRSRKPPSSSSTPPGCACTRPPPPAGRTPVTRTFTATLQPLGTTIPDPALIVLIGAAGSGKSTFAATWNPSQVLELDAVRAMISDSFPCQVQLVEAGAGPGAGSRPYLKAWQDARHVRQLSKRWRTRLEPTAYDITRWSRCRLFESAEALTADPRL